MDQALSSKPLSSSVRDKVFSEQVKILHNHLATSIPGNFICALIIFISTYEFSKQIAIVWFSAVILTSIFRFVGLYLYHHYPDHDKFHLSVLVSTMILSAVLWGLMDSVLMPTDPLAQTLVMVIAAGVTAGGIQTLNANLVASMVYLNVIILPLCAFLLLQHSFAYNLLNAAVMTYYLFMLVTSIRNNKLLTQSLYLKYENLALIDKLSVSNNKLLNAYQLLEKHDQKIVLMNKMNDQLQVCNDMIAAYHIIQSSGKQLFEDLNGSLFMRDILNHHLEMVATWGDSKMLESSFTTEDCLALRKGHAYAIAYPERNVACQHFTTPPNTSICLPLGNQLQNMGLLILHTPAKEAMTHEQIQFAHTFAEVIQLSLSNIKLRENLYDQSIHDPLTGLFNRRFLDETLPRELQRIIRDKQTLCVAMLDIDHFKSFNDNNGHEAGDEILKYVAMLLRGNFRGHDISCRFGGEEFTIVMTSTDIESAKLRLENFRRMVKAGKVYFNEILLPTITVSIGLAEAPLHGATSNTVIHAADIALYTAKQGGRDRIEQAKTHHVDSVDMTEKA